MGNPGFSDGTNSGGGTSGSSSGGGGKVDIFGMIFQSKASATLDISFSTILLCFLFSHLYVMITTLGTIHLLL